MSLKFSVGDLTIHRIIEQETTFLPALEMLAGLTPELLAENRPWMQKASAIDASDVLILCFQCYIVQTPHHTILVDSCIGNDKPRPLRPKWNMKTDDIYMRGLAAAGFSVGDIDFVMCTHLDVDQAQAAVTRRNFLERYCDTETLCCTAHFPSPSTGKIRRWGDGFSCEAVAG